MAKFSVFSSFVFLAITLADSVVHWNLPSSPENAQSVSQDYIGFGIEMTSFPDYAGQNEPNIFSNFMLHQLSKRTNSSVPLRIGGTSMDNTRYNASQTSAYIATGSKNCSLHREGTIGRPWLEKTFRNLNASFTRYILDVPLARPNHSNGVEFARDCINAMPSKTRQLDAIEIGNEPNLYTSYPIAPCSQGKDRPQGYGALDYVKEWRDYAKVLMQDVQALNESGRKDWVQGWTIASGYKPDEWNLNTNRWDALKKGDYLKTFSQHYYQVHADGNVTDYPPDHLNTVNGLEQKFRPNLNFLKTHSPTTPFILGEVGTVITTSKSHPNHNLLNRLGSALWTLDFMLYGMTMGIERVSIQMATSFVISAWHPVAPKAVRGSYYGMVAAADFIGVQGRLKIKYLSTEGHSNIAGYAGFNGDMLTKVAVLNLNFWEKADGGGDRPRRHARLTGLGSDVKKIKVSRLTALGGATDTRVHWAGKRWTAENEGMVYDDGEKPLMIGVSDGVPVKDVVIGASEAVLVELLRD